MRSTAYLDLINFSFDVDIIWMHEMYARHTPRVPASICSSSGVTDDRANLTLAALPHHAAPLAP